MAITIQIGRNPQSEICVDDRFDTVSNNHATIEYDGESLIFIDHSSNGSVINNQRVKNMQVNIYQGDEILLAGSYRLSWNEINRFIPRMGRPTVTRNTHEVKPGVDRPTIDNRQKAQSMSRVTDLYNVEYPPHNYISDDNQKRISTKNDKTIINIRCPECGNISDSIKKYTMIDYLVFLGIAAFGRRVTYTCCPHCMRKHIIMKGFTYNILTANLLWLFLIIPWSIVLLIVSYTKGHSSSVIQMLEEDLSDQ